LPASGSVALVTGASRGIGRAIATRLAQRGVRVAVHYRNNRQAAEETLSSLTGTGHFCFDADLAQASEPSLLWQRVVDRMGPVDILINNAGLYVFHPPLSSKFPQWQSAWQQTIAANLLGPADLSLLAAQSMAARGGGRIVNISSRGAFRGEPDAPAYAASKAGLNALSGSLARALAPAGVYVYCIAPGWVETDMATEHLQGPGGAAILAQHPMGRVIKPDEIANATVYCALDAPAAMTGSIMDVNGASHLRS
jgi:NAD(P)-dependent dehydrogenase (short-subunit alcohol dehydrogenase family)